MTDPQKENTAETPDTNYSEDLASSASPAPDTEQVEPAETSRPEFHSRPTASPEEIAENKPSKPPLILAKSGDSRIEATPAPIKVATAPKAKPAATVPPDSHVTDSSISIDEDSRPNVSALIIDSIAAAVAIAFTLLLLQDIIPFL